MKGIETTQDLKLLEPAGPSPTVAPTRRLRPLYYLHNIQLALTSLRQRYAGLLSAEEADFIDCFEVQVRPVQCLVARLVMRKGPLYRRATLQYTEVPDLERAIDSLAALGWLDPDPRLCASELAEVLNAEELRLGVGIQRGRSSRSKGHRHQDGQLLLPLQDQPVVHRSLQDWNACLAHAVVRLSVAPLIRRLECLFFGNEYQTWAEFVLADLGVAKYECVAMEASARAFNTREEIEHFFRLNECRARLDSAESASAIHECTSVPEGVCDWLRSGFRQLQVRLGERLEEEGLSELALQCYRESNTAQGLVNAIQYQVRLGLFEGAWRDAKAAQEMVCGEAQREAIERAMVRINPQASTAPRRGNAPDRTDAVELVMPKPTGRKRIETAVLERLSEPLAPVFYVENTLMRSLFGLLCWEAIFAPVQGAFFHPFQNAPADLYSADFRARRVLHFNTSLGMLDSDAYETAAWKLYRAKAGTRAHFVHWGKLKPRLLTLALRCIPACHLKLYFERFLEDLQENTTGMPDLIQFWPQERRYRWIEVKGPGDRLQYNQRRWLRFFSQHAMPAAVCQVQWQPERES